MIVFTDYFIFEGFYCDIFNEHFENCLSAFNNTKRMSPRPASRPRPVDRADAYCRPRTASVANTLPARRRDKLTPTAKKETGGILNRPSFKSILRPYEHFGNCLDAFCKMDFALTENLRFRRFAGGNQREKMIVFTLYFIFEGFYCDIFNEHFENCLSAFNTKRISPDPAAPPRPVDRADA